MDVLSRRASALLWRSNSSSPLSPNSKSPSLKIDDRPKPREGLSQLSSTIAKFPPGVRRATTPPPDPTPDSIAALEGLLNFHLAQIDTMKARKRWLREQRERDWIILTRLQMERHREREVKFMADRVEGLSECRQGCQRNLWWHIDESERLGKLVKKKMNKRKAEMAAQQQAEKEQIELKSAAENAKKNQKTVNDERENEGTQTLVEHSTPPMPEAPTPYRPRVAFADI